MIELKSLSPANPCGYLAALGLIRVLSPHCEIKLAWSGEWADVSVVVECDQAESVDQLAELLAKHHDANWIPKGKDIRKFKKSPANWIARSDRTDKNGFVLATQWRYEAVKARSGWTDQIRNVEKEVRKHDKQYKRKANPAQYLRALTEWTQSDAASPLGFDPSAFQDSARQANTASATKPICTAAAIWLAVSALPLFPVFSTHTAGIIDNTFHYPTWKHPLGLDSIKAICTGYRGPNDLKHIPGGVTAWESVVESVGARKQWTMAVPA